ncbi:MAG TPA: bifunctional DNA-formamidopyrimidine glycosylase/DNA-(apurinic or apyrimidinic site) lyase [Polyangiaceae bacterium]|jgi:formamidopyrimidine-DNA glycosylase|nr:bifunctional DNA-formamidopyrimidine glycosylase/DNA-(apurinic or apyrimidinic site) lyase [Polyangiaceae bacterium]
MPELPEVEVTRRAIEKTLVGRRIVRVKTTAPSYFFLTPPARLRRALTERKVVELVRHGKYLVARLDDGARLLLHLGMTGQLFTAGARSVRLLSAERRSTLAASEQAAFVPDAHTHLELEFADGPPGLYFRDIRKFGKVRLLAEGQSDPRLDKLGVDALVATGQELFAAAQKRNIPVKSLLLEQGVIAGIGNIYADEALFFARVRPTRPARRVTRAECDAIVKAARRVLERAIVKGGSSIDDFVRPDGSDGEYQAERKVYARTGAPCPRCKTPIRRIVIGQRSAHFCPECQR